MPVAPRPLGHGPWPDGNATTRARADGASAAGACARIGPVPRKEAGLDGDPHYDPGTDTYRQIYRGHDNASAVTNTQGVTVYFDPDTNEVLGFAIANFTAYYQAHATPEGSFEVDLPTRVPANLEEEMDFDAEQLRSGVRIAEFY